MTSPAHALARHNDAACHPADCPFCAAEIADERDRRVTAEAAMSDHVVWSSEPCDCEAGGDHDLGQEVRDA